MGERIGVLIRLRWLTRRSGRGTILPHIVDTANAVNAGLNESTFTWVVPEATQVSESDRCRAD